MGEIVKGFKVFNADWTCRNKQYSCPGKFEENVVLSMCGKGMHFCKKVIDCFNYYDFAPSHHVAEVIAYGDVVEKGDKCVTDKLEIVREISWSELLEIVNSGNRNSGNCNSGNFNSGNFSSGNRNSGNCNSGDCNSGDWNQTDFSNGCFNTKKQTIHMFNRPSDWTYDDWLNSEACSLMRQIQMNAVKWVRAQDVSEKEAAAHPEVKTTNGYLKVLDNTKSAIRWWKTLNQRQKNVITAIPNFNKEIFKEITGIDVDIDSEGDNHEN